MTSQPNDRAPREDESREAMSREAAWTPPSSLPDPHRRPSLVHRYIRTASMGQQDPVNVSNAFREGWVPVHGPDYPELKILSDPGSRWPDSVEIGGLLLCSAPVSRMSQRMEYYGRMVKDQIQSVNNQYKSEEDPRLQTMFRESSHVVTRGFGPGRGRQEPSSDT